MKKYGYRKTHGSVSGHQGCNICHPEVKSGRNLEKCHVNDEILTGLEDYAISLLDLDSDKLFDESEQS